MCAVVMEPDDSEAAAAAALLLIVEEGYRDLKREYPAVAPTVERVKARSDAFGEKVSSQRNAAAILAANSQEGVKMRKAGSRQKLSKTSQGKKSCFVLPHEMCHAHFFFAFSL